MAEAEKQAAKKTMPKGGRKGGTLFPRMGLSQALEYSKKLVAKTHIGPQPAKTVLPGVFGSSKTIGKVRASALKQYGLMKGGSDAYEATELAKKIEAAPEDDRGRLLLDAFLRPKVFKEMYDTFHGDSVSKAKIRQQALALNVHPESGDDCVENFIESAITARLGTVDGDTVSLASPEPGAGSTPQGEEEANPGGKSGAPKDTAKEPPPPGGRSDEIAAGVPSRTAKSGLTLTLNVDSSSDPDKLQKQLELLKKYGVI